jgi:hypothetical protein
MACCVPFSLIRALWLKWYVTQAMRVIAESATTSAEVVLRKEELVRYMAWRSDSVSFAKG